MIITHLKSILLTKSCNLPRPPRPFPLPPTLPLPPWCSISISSLLIRGALASPLHPLTVSNCHIPSNTLGKMGLVYWDLDVQLSWVVMERGNGFCRSCSSLLFILAFLLLHCPLTNGLMSLLLSWRFYFDVLFFFYGNCIWLLFSSHSLTWFISVFSTCASNNVTSYSSKKDEYIRFHFLLFVCSGEETDGRNFGSNLANKNGPLLKPCCLKVEIKG